MNNATPVIQAPNVITFNVNIQVFLTPQRVLANCNEIAFYNQGATNVVINGSLILQPTQSFSPGGNQFEKDVTVYDLGFEGGTGSCAVIRKFYNTQ